MGTLLMDEYFDMFCHTDACFAVVILMYVCVSGIVVVA